MSVLPTKLDGVVSHSADLRELCIRDAIEFDRPAMPLAKSAGTVAAKVIFRVVSHMAVIPRDAHQPFFSHVVDLCRQILCHWIRLTRDYLERLTALGVFGYYRELTRQVGGNVQEDFADLGIRLLDQNRHPVVSSFPQG